MWFDARFPLPNGSYRTKRRGALRTFLLLSAACVLFFALAVYVMGAGRGRAPIAVAVVPAIPGVLFCAAALLSVRAVFPRALTVDDHGARGQGFALTWDQPQRAFVFENVLIVNPGQPQWGLKGKVHRWTGVLFTDASGRVTARLLGSDWDSQLLEALAVRSAQGPAASPVIRSDNPVGGAYFLNQRRIRP